VSEAVTRNLLAFQARVLAGQQVGLDHGNALKISNIKFNTRCLNSKVRCILACLTQIANLTNRNYSLNCSVKVKFTLEQATKAQRGSTGIALLFL
jgi:hypothetical protein